MVCARRGLSPEPLLEILDGNVATGFRGAAEIQSDPGGVCRPRQVRQRST